MSPSPRIPSSLLAAPAALFLFACRGPAPPEGGEPLAVRPPAQGAPSETQEAPPPAPPGETPAALLTRRAEEQTVEAQRRSVLIERHLNLARELRGQGRLEDAEREAAAALDVDPDHREARELLAEIGALLGKRGGEVRTIQKELEEQWELKLQALRAEAAEALERGRAALEAKEFDRAIEEFSLVLQHVKWAPTGLQGTDLEAGARAGLEEARGRKQQEEERVQRDRERETFEKLKEEESRERTRRQALLQTILARGIQAFESGRYREAVETADRALAEDPRNPRAKELREAAFKASLDQGRRDYIASKREEFRRWREDLLEARIPYADLLTLPDPEFWAEISRLRSNRAAEGFAAAEPEDARKLRELLRTTKLPSLQVKDETNLGSVVGFVRTITGLPIVVDPAAIQKIDQAGVTFQLDIQHPISAGHALDLIYEYAGGEVTHVYRHDAILVTTKEKAKGTPVVRNHDIQDLVFGLTTFLGPKIGDIRLPGGAQQEEGGGIFGGVGEVAPIVNADQLIAVIKESLAPGTWEGEGHSIDALNGNLIVVHDLDVQQQVAKFLQDLRTFTASLVTVEAKFLTVSENFLQEIGVDFRGLGGEAGTLANLDDVTNGLEDNSSLALDNLGPGLATGAGTNPSSGLFFNEGGDSEFRARTENFFETNLGSTLSNRGGATFAFTLLDDAQLSLVFRAVEKAANLQIVNSQILSVHNTQRAYLTVVNQTSYIQDFDVEVAQAAFIADPQINVIPDGVVLEVTPTIHHDRKYLTLELQPTVATLLRPIPTFTTSLAALSIPVTFQIPELRVQSAATTVVIPDGGSVLIGGLKQILNKERRASVPILERIPLISALFKKEGVSDENQSLSVLIRAWIMDVKEEAKKIAAR
ncbi:MAG TPA: tetratricopeptide repeat protein [Planctomycetota bacterium]|jgi:general secretion pathway protein D|nr:tetratricopeptide repeat protein [Planctomycetota bacterium]